MTAVDPLAALLRDTDPGQLESLLIRGQITAWNATTGANTVTAGGATYTNLPFLGAPAGIGVGAALLIYTSASPVILGRIYFPPI